MAPTWKLQGEVDRVGKKVQESVDLMDNLWIMVRDSNKASQREELIGELKKEAKKIQRYKDHIKTLLKSSEICKVAGSYEQALMDSSKLIERVTRRFKDCCEDFKENSKSETRSWLNNVIRDLGSQVDNFESEIEMIIINKGNPRPSPVSPSENPQEDTDMIKKGKTTPPRLAKLQKIVSRHKAWLLKLELVLRLLDNDFVRPDQVNDSKALLEDYVKRNQEIFSEFDNVDHLYDMLPINQWNSEVTLDPSSYTKDATEKAKTESENWLHKLIGDLEGQIVHFEAEAEGLALKKGNRKPLRLTHLEKSISRHRAHIFKLKVILGLLENNRLSPDQVNDIKDFLEDYVERNQENFDEFDDVGELYSILLLDNPELKELIMPSPVTTSLSAAKRELKK